MRTRRQLLTASALPWLALLPGCGFQLRQAPDLKFSTIQLTGFRPHSPFAEELRERIDASKTTKVVPGPAQAQVVLRAIEDAREKVVVISNSVGRVTEFQLRERFTFQVRNTAGRELIPRTELSQFRDLSYTESAALAKEQEEDFLYRAMQLDIVNQVLRRLTAVDKV